MMTGADIAALKAYVQADDGGMQNRDAATVLLHVSHSNLAARFMEIRLDLHVSLLENKLPKVGHQVDAPTQVAANTQQVCRGMLCLPTLTLLASSSNKFNPNTASRAHVRAKLVLGGAAADVTHRRARTDDSRRGEDQADDAQRHLAQRHAAAAEGRPGAAAGGAGPGPFVRLLLAARRVRPSQVAMMLP